MTTLNNKRIYRSQKVSGNMKKITILSILSICALSACLLCACDSKTEDTPAQTQDKQTAATLTEGNSLYGKVTAIDGNKITLALGEMPEMPQGAPGGQKTDDNAATDGQKTPPVNREQNSNTTDGSDNSNPDTQPPSGISDTDAKGQRKMLTLSGETKEITISDESIIFNGTLADISVDSVLKLTYEGDTLTAVQLVTPMGGPNGNGAPPEGSNKQNPPAQNGADNAAATDT